MCTSKDLVTKHEFWVFRERGNHTDGGLDYIHTTIDGIVVVCRNSQIHGSIVRDFDFHGLADTWYLVVDYPSTSDERLHSMVAFTLIVWIPPIHGVCIRCSSDYLISSSGRERGPGL